MLTMRMEKGILEEWLGLAPLPSLYQLFNQFYDCAEELDENRNQDYDIALVILVAVLSFSSAHCFQLLFVLYLS